MLSMKSQISPQNMRLLLIPPLQVLSKLSTKKKWFCCTTEFSGIDKFQWNKSDMTWNWSFDMPCKSLKGILVLFEEEKPYAQDTSKFYNPKIEKSLLL